MDQEPDVTNEKPEVIRQQIDETRSSLTEKLETLEGTVRDTVQGARDSVTDTIENVKDTVQDTVDTVKRTLDLKHQVRQHPWSMVGGSFLTGFILGGLTSGHRLHGHGGSVAEGMTAASSGSFLHESPRESSRFGNGRQAAEASESTRSASGPSWFETLTDQFDDEIREVKGMAIGTLLGLVRDFVKDKVPSHLAPQIEKLIDGATTKLGGRTIASPVLDPSEEELPSHHGDPRRSSGYTNPVI